MGALSSDVDFEEDFIAISGGAAEIDDQLVKVA